MYLLPQPKKIVEGVGTFRLQYSGKIRLDAGKTGTETGTETAKEVAAVRSGISCFGGANPAPMHALYSYAKLLQQEIEQVTACDYEVTTVTCASQKQDNEGSILLSLQAPQEAGIPKQMLAAPQFPAQSYHLVVTAESVRLTGFGEAGLLYGVQTLRQMIRQYGTALPAVEIWDEPAIANRGFYFDVSRGRIPKLEELKRLADVCSFYKLNQLQLYVEHSYLFEGFGETWREDTPLTAEEIMDFDAYCAALQIDLVPSLSSFGHLYGVLRTRQYGHLSELEDERKGFFMVERMEHHTVDVTNEESFVMVRDRILDYMRLFRSDKFNICADETFDLGKGRSKAAAEERGKTELYLEFLDKLCRTLIAAGKKPMFWGDIILKNPENIKRLPAEAICLNWEYDSNVREDNLRTFVEAGAKHLYVCPGVQGWQYLINRHHDAYLNIAGMCRNAHKYGVEGVLNTCWGDLGHIAHPEFSTIGLIYGAAFSWSACEMAEADVNTAISVLEYGDRSGRIAERLSEISRLQDINWWRIVEFKEGMQKGMDAVTYCENLLKQESAVLQEHIRCMEELMQEVYDDLLDIAQANRERIVANLLMARGHVIWAEIDYVIADSILQTGNPFTTDYAGLAEELEEWLMEYKKLWRKSSKESELHRLVDVTCWYADYLRDLRN